MGPSRQFSFHLIKKKQSNVSQWTPVMHYHLSSCFWGITEFQKFPSRLHPREVTQRVGSKLLWTVTSKCCSCNRTSRRPSTFHVQCGSNTRWLLARMVDSPVRSIVLIQVDKMSKCVSHSSPLPSGVTPLWQVQYPCLCGVISVMTPRRALKSLKLAPRLAVGTVTHLSIQLTQAPRD